MSKSGGELCPHRVPLTSWCKRCARGEGSKKAKSPPKKRRTKNA